MTMVEERKYVKPEEPEEIDETHTDRNIQHELVESDKKLVTTRRQVRDLDKVRNTAKRPKPAFDAHENPHTPTTRKVPPVETSSIFKPTPHSPASSNLAKPSSVQDQEDPTEKLAPQHM